MALNTSVEVEEEGTVGADVDSSSSWRLVGDIIGGDIVGGLNLGTRR